MSALGLLLLPGHVDEGPLDVVVDDLGSAAGPRAHLLLVSGVAFDAQPDFLQTALLQHLRQTGERPAVPVSGSQHCARNGQLY